MLASLFGGKGKPSTSQGEIKKENEMQDQTQQKKKKSRNIENRRDITGGAVFLRNIQPSDKRPNFNIDYRDNPFDLFE